MSKILNDSFLSKIIKTFIEGFIASLVISLPNINSFNDKELLKSILVGAIAMGISAVLNLLQDYLKKENA